MSAFARGFAPWPQSVAGPHYEACPDAGIEFPSRGWELLDELHSQHGLVDVAALVVISVEGRKR